MSALGGVAGAHQIAAIVIELACEEGIGVLTGVVTRLQIVSQLAFDPIPGRLIDDRGVKPLMNLPLVAKPTDIDRVRQDLVEMAPADETPAGPLAGPVDANGQADIFGVENGLEPHDAADREVTLEEIANKGGMFL